MSRLHPIIKCLLIAVSCLSFIDQSLVQGGFYEDVEFIDKRAYGVYTPTFAWHMAKFVCEITGGTNRQIEHPETVVAIARFFRETRQVPICREKYDRVVQAMAKVIQAGERDLCAPEKIDAIVDFHKVYISKSSIESIGAQIPKLLELFYLRYANKISKTCKNQVLEHIESPKFKKAEAKFAEKAAELKELDRIMGEYSIMSSSISGSIKSFYNIDLLWAAIDRSPLEPELEGVLTAPSAANNFKRVNLATSGSEKILKVQRQCESLKPHYESPLLNTIRLIDLGYYLEDEPFARTLSKRPNLMRIIGLVIICETLLPMRVIQDDSLGLGESKFVKNTIRVNNNPPKVDSNQREESNNKPEVINNKPEVTNNKPEVTNNQQEVINNQQEVIDNNQPKPSIWAPKNPQVFQPPPYTTLEPMTNQEIERMKKNIDKRDSKSNLMKKGFLGKIKLKYKSFYGRMFQKKDPKPKEDITELFDVLK